MRLSGMPALALGLILLCALAPAQLSQITPAGLLPDQQTLDFTGASPGPIGPSDPLFLNFGLTSVALIGTWTPGSDVLSQCVSGNALASVGGQLAVVASGGPLDDPSPSVGFAIQLQGKVTQAGFMPVDECCWSMDVEVYDGPVLLGSLTVPNIGNCVAMVFESIQPFDEVRFISTSAFGGWGLDDLMLAGFQGPSCAVTAPLAGATTSDVVAVDVDVDHLQGLPVDVSFEYSTDSGVSFWTCTAGGAVTNPTLAVAVPSTVNFEWDSRADGVGIAALATGVIVRSTVDDGSMSVTCDSAPFDVDNQALCVGICGDCNLNGVGSQIVDALTAAQIAAAIIVPTIPQDACCDVNSSGATDILDALAIAQESAGLPVTLTCL